VKSNFNPAVSAFRVHWFSPRHCFDFLIPERLTDFGRETLNQSNYYSSDKVQPDFLLKRLGRRSRKIRYLQAQDKRLKPHRFWSEYLSNVASDDYRGTWFGLAPLRFEFRDKVGQPLLRANRKDALSSNHGIEDIRAYPKAYLCPIGWTVGVVADIRGAFSLSDTPAMVKWLRTQPSFSCEGRTLRLDDSLGVLHDKVRTSLISNNAPFPLIDPALDTYIVASPITFEGQADFDGGSFTLDSGLVFELLTGGRITYPKMLIKPGLRSITVTVMRRGTLLLTQVLELDSPTARCALSNLKNSLMMLALMQRFHNSAQGHKSTQVQKMREEVGQTFARFFSAWHSPHFHQICEAHTGVQRMLERQSGSTYNFYKPEIHDSAIGDGSTVIARTAPSGTPLNNSSKEGPMGKYDFKDATITNAAIGDYATFVQAAEPTQLATELVKAHKALSERATTDEQKADAAKVKAAADEAAKGNSEGAWQKLKQVGNWGLSMLKEVATSLALEGLKQLFV
jgi:hypothetical protein